MKKFRFILLGMMGFLISSFMGLCLYQTVRKKMTNARAFPDNIQNAYYVAFLKIPDPIAIRIAEDYFVLPRSVLSTYDGCDSMLLGHNDVVKLYDAYYLHEKFDDRQLLKMEHASKVEMFLVPVDSKCTLPVYGFRYPPKDFMLVLLRKHEMICEQEPDVWTVKYEKDYIPVLSPRFTRKQLKKMTEKYYEEN